MTTWFINKTYPDSVQQSFAGIDQVTALAAGELISSSSISQVIKYSIEGKCFYVKHYFARGKKWRRFFGRSRWRAEWENLVFCKTLDIHVPNIVAYGEKKQWLGLASHGIIVTEEVPDAMDLRMLVDRRPELFQEKAWRHQIILKMADYLKNMHQKHFIHYDLQWRNILVTKNPEQPQVYLFDIPSGRIRHSTKRFGVKRDFYNLYKNAQIFLSQTDQLRFYLAYKQSHSLTIRDKQFIKILIAYFRWKEFAIKEATRIESFKQRAKSFFSLLFRNSR